MPAVPGEIDAVVTHYVEKRRDGTEIKDYRGWAVRRCAPFDKSHWESPENFSETPTCFNCMLKGPP